MQEEMQRFLQRLQIGLLPNRLRTFLSRRAHQHKRGHQSQARNCIDPINTVNAEGGNRNPCQTWSDKRGILPNAPHYSHVPIRENRLARPRGDKE
jgi:hypothetical protein